MRHKKRADRWLLEPRLLWRFAYGVGRILWRWLCALSRWLLNEERLIWRKLRHAWQVAQRLPNWRRQLAFLWRWLHYVARRFYYQPHAIKLTQLLIIAVILSSPHWGQWLQQKWRYQGYYDAYYQILYHRFEPTMESGEAQWQADYYADYYASYFASRSFTTALRQGLRQVREAPLSLPINSEGLALIKRFEGLALQPYRDAAGHLTIGYGHRIMPGEVFTEISESDAEKLLREDVASAVATVRRNTEVPLTANQFSALVSLVYNIGSGQFARSTLLEELNSGDYAAAGREFLSWRKAGGVVLSGLEKRRHAEWVLFTRR